MTTMTKFATLLIAGLCVGTLSLHAETINDQLEVKGNLVIKRQDGNGSYISFWNPDNGHATIQLYNTNPGYRKLGIFDAAGGYGIDHILLRSGGLVEMDTPQVSIGTSRPVSDYALTVNGGIYALDLRIRPNLNNTADFVFDETYDLPSLEDVELSIKQNRHLPGIPSAQTMVEEGVSVAEMNAKLLQKIEELTLYVIQQHKEIERLKMQQPLSAAH